MKRNDWENAFGDVPAAFSVKVGQAVAQMQRKASPAPRRKPVLLLAAALALVAGTAFALSQLGLLDILQETLRAFLRPEATKLVQTDLAQTAQQPNHAAFTVEEAINDGHRIYATVRVHGDGDALLMDYNAEAAWPADWWQGGEGTESFSKRAYDAGRMLVQASVYAVDAGGQALTAESAEIHYDGEDILYTLSFPADGPQATLRLYTYEVFEDSKPHSERLSAGQLELTVPVTDARGFYAAETPVDLPIGKMTLTSLTVEQTPIATYMTLEFGAADGAPDLTYIHLRDGVWADWLDENGERYPEGTHANSQEKTMDGKTRLVTVYRAFDVLPDSVTLRFRNGMTGEAFDTVTIPLHTTTEGEN